MLSNFASIQDKINLTPSYRNHLTHDFKSANGDYAPGADFCVQVGECSRTPQSGFAESIKAARLIYDGLRDGQTLGLCMSGGLDSDCMAQAFLAAGIPFTTYILRFNNSLNWYDIQDAADFCESNRIPFHYVDIDIIDFFESQKYLEYAVKYRCISPQLAAHLYLLDKMDDVPILSWNPTPILLNKKNEAYPYLPTDLYFCYERFFKANHRPGVGLFFMYTPELIYSFLRTPVLQNLILQRGPAAGRASSYWSKCQAYKQSGFQMRPRETNKTGFEMLKKFFAEKYGRSENVFNELFRVPLEEIFPPPSQNIRRLSKKYLYVDPLA